MRPQLFRMASELKQKDELDKVMEVCSEYIKQHRKYRHPECTPEKSAVSEHSCARRELFPDS